MAEKVENGKIVSFSYTLKDKEGKVLEQTEKSEPMQYLHGKQNIIPGLEKELEGLEVGDSKSVTVEPKEAYGEYDENMTFKVPKQNFPPDVTLTPGMQFQTETENGPMVIEVKEILDNEIVVDANHPMAGETLHFDITIDEIRDATEQEKSHGHVHAHGHDH